MSVTDSLQVVLANTYLLYLKTQNYHWNVAGGSFFIGLHELFEKQYNELAEAVDVIAERIRQLGPKVPATFADFAKAAELKEGDANKTSQQMLADLAADQDKIIQVLKNAWDVADKSQDEVTADMLIERMEAHSKAAWFYKSSIE